MREEWSNEEQWEQYRPQGGYVRLINYLAETASRSGTTIHLSSIVKELQWRNGHVQALTHEGNQYAAAKAIITVPLGILQAPADAKAAIRFTPAIPDKIAAAREMGFGAVIKIILQFDHAFWNDRRDSKGNTIREMGYLFTDAFVPTWWTQYPDPSSMLTGWLGGPKAADLKDASEATVLQVALENLAEIFDVEKLVLRKMLTAFRIYNWTSDPFVLGAYAYNTLASAEAKKRLREPVSNTLYFAGEALGEGFNCATVEVALASGKEVANSISAAEK
jgi:monoamine oxidase